MAIAYTVIKTQPSVRVGHKYKKGEKRTVLTLLVSISVNVL